MPANFIFAFVLFGVCFPLLFLYLRRTDRERIAEEIGAGGGKVIRIVWTPFASESFVDSSGRYYRVHYFDRDGNEHVARCRTSMWTGVWLKDDHIVVQKNPVK